MSKEVVIAEIRRTAAENGGEPLGMNRFQKETGITRDAWLGKYWRRWSEALAEAGFTPNERTPPAGRDALLGLLSQLTRELRRFPTDADIALARANGAELPHKHTFRNSLGAYDARVELVREFASAHSEYQDIVAWLPPPNVDQTLVDREQIRPDGAVYMLKLGKFYKIGKSFRVPQRHREISIELPEKPDVIHVIATDDPTGIEAYWHARFETKRTNGEWFALAADDVRAFKRRKFM